MSAPFAFLGLHAPIPGQPPTPYLTSHYAIAYFLLAYVLLSTRPLKMYLGIDHQVSPREDLVKYGPSFVQRGKITQAQLELLKRNEGAHANSMEHWPFFVGGMVFATLVGVPAEVVNRCGLLYLSVRVAYGGVYLWAGTLKKANLRGPLWWVSNGICIWLWWRGGKELNGKL